MKDKLVNYAGKSPLKCALLAEKYLLLSSPFSAPYLRKSFHDLQKKGWKKAFCSLAYDSLPDSTNFLQEDCCSLTMSLLMGFGLYLAVRTASDVSAFPNFVPAVCAHNEARKLRLVFVTPRGFCNDSKAALAIVNEVIQGGISQIQIRDADATEQDVMNVAFSLVRKFEDPTMFSINGPHAVNAIKQIPGLGIHIKERHINRLLPIVSEMKLSNTLVGCSIHSVPSAKRAIRLGRLDYLQVGTMFQTPSHPRKIPEGLNLMQDVRQAVPPTCSLVGVGGIDVSNVAEVIQHSADGVAVISAISSAPDPKLATQKLLAAIRDALASLQ